MAANWIWYVLHLLQGQQDRRGTRSYSMYISMQISFVLEKKGLPYTWDR